MYYVEDAEAKAKPKLLNTADVHYVQITEQPTVVNSTHNTGTNDD